MMIRVQTTRYIYFLHIIWISIILLAFGVQIWIKKKKKKHVLDMKYRWNRTMDELSTRPLVSD